MPKNRRGAFPAFFKRGGKYFSASSKATSGAKKRTPHGGRRAPGSQARPAGSIPGRVRQPKQCEDAPAQALRHSLFEGIQDGHIEVREITFVPSGHGEAMNASRNDRRQDHSGVTQGTT